MSGSGGGLQVVPSIAVKASIGASLCLRKTSRDSGGRAPGTPGTRVSVSQTKLAPPLLAHPRCRRVAASRLALRPVAQIRSAGPQKRTFKDCPKPIRPNPSHL